VTGSQAHTGNPHRGSWRCQWQKECPAAGLPVLATDWPGSQPENYSLPAFRVMARDTWESGCLSVTQAGCEPATWNRNAPLAHWHVTLAEPARGLLQDSGYRRGRCHTWNQLPACTGLEERGREASCGRTAGLQARLAGRPSGLPTRMLACCRTCCRTRAADADAARLETSSQPALDCKREGGRPAAAGLQDCRRI